MRRAHGFCRRRGVCFMSDWTPCLQRYFRNGDVCHELVRQNCRGVCYVLLHAFSAEVLLEWWLVQELVWQNCRCVCYVLLHAFSAEVLLEWWLVQELVWQNCRCVWCVVHPEGDPVRLTGVGGGGGQRSKWLNWCVFTHVLWGDMRSTCWEDTCWEDILLSEFLSVDADSVLYIYAESVSLCVCVRAFVCTRVCVCMRTCVCVWALTGSVGPGWRRLAECARPALSVTCDVGSGVRRHLRRTHKSMTRLARAAVPPHNALQSILLLYCAASPRGAPGKDVESNGRTEPDVLADLSGGTLHWPPLLLPLFPSLLLFPPPPHVAYMHAFVSCLPSKGWSLHPLSDKPY